MGMLENGTFFVQNIEDIKNAQKEKDNIKCLQINETIEEIPSGAFEKFDALEKLIPHNKLRVIGESAFRFCKKLQHLGDLSSIETVGDHAFNNCVCIESVSLTNAVEIGKYAFVCCEKIKSINAPRAREIGKNAFNGCGDVDSSKVFCPYASTLKDAFHGDLFSVLRENESKTYRKRFKLFLINFWECALRVESYNRFNEAQPQDVLHAELSKDIEKIANNYTRRNEKKGAKYLQGGEILNMIHGPILRETAEGEGESESKFDVGEESVWVIPIKAYNEVVRWLRTIGTVERLISEKDLDFAQAAGERAFENKYEGPSTGAKELQRVPVRLRNQLTSWQRDGVAFCVDRDGRCLLGDEVSCRIDYEMRGGGRSLYLYISKAEEPTHISFLPFISILKMGLGKTIQSIASMSAFKEDWPLLIICPAVATTNWKAELLKWLKENKNSKKDDGTLVLNDHNIVMLTNWNDSIATQIEAKDKEKVFIASYERATKLVGENKLQAGMFKAVIIDESHNLKSGRAKRTQAISKIATEAKRKLLLSGTPALSDPKELRSQISLLEANKNEIGNSSFIKYIDDGSKNEDDLGKLLNASEFGTKLNMLMKRRLKDDVTNLTPKTREFVLVDTGCKDIESRAQSFLKTSKGRLASIMREAAEYDDNEIACNEFEGSPLVDMRLKTGMAKVPRVLEELNGFINNEDNKEMKLCIFARHKAVLNALEASGESLTMDSLTKCLKLRFSDSFLNSFL